MESHDPLVKIEIDVAEDPWRMAQGEDSQETASASLSEPPPIKVEPNIKFEPGTMPEMKQEVSAPGCAGVDGQEAQTVAIMGSAASTGSAAWTESARTQNPEVPGHVEYWQRQELVTHTVQEPQNTLQNDASSTRTCSQSLKERLKVKLTQRLQKPQATQDAVSASSIRAPAQSNNALSQCFSSIAIEPCCSEPTRVDLQEECERHVMVEPGTRHCAHGKTDSETGPDNKSPIKLEPGVKVEPQAEWEPDVWFEPGTSICTDSKMDSDTTCVPNSQDTSLTMSSTQSGKGELAHKGINPFSPTGPCGPWPTGTCGAEGVKLEPGVQAESETSPEMRHETQDVGTSEWAGTDGSDSQSAASTGSAQTHNSEPPDHAAYLQRQGIVIHTGHFTPLNFVYFPALLVHQQPQNCSQNDPASTVTSSGRLKERLKLKLAQGCQNPQEPYKCSQCDATFRHAGALKKHLLTHPGQKPHKCTECDASFRSPSTLRAHKLIHTGRIPFKCTQCDASFRYAWSLKIHMKTHSDERPHKCTQCDASFKFDYDLKSHMLIHTGEKPHKCTECGACFRLSCSLRRHMLIHTRQERYKCLQCDACFRDRSTLKKHRASHTDLKPYKCTQCDTRFRRKRGLDNHMMIHLGQKPFKCSQCDAGFRQKASLKFHMMGHSGETPYKCDQCDASYRRKFDLKNHMSKHTGEKPYTCSQCGSTFSAAHYLKSHMLTHTELKPYKCAECNGSFKRKGDLERHVLIHTDQKPYKCAECNVSFKQRGSLQRHMLIHSGKKPYTCRQCDRSFREACKLKLHMLSHSSEKA